MKHVFFFSFLLLAGCYQASIQESLSLIQIQDRNGLTETISNPERLASHKTTNFLAAQPYKKVLRVYKSEKNNSSIITTYYPNGTLKQYLEAKKMRAHGAYREWFPNGVQKVEATVIGGTADLIDGSQDDWLFDGNNLVWDDKGNLTANIVYYKGALQGTSTYYFPSGNIQRELNYDKNQLHGLCFEYTNEGNLKGKFTYKQGVQEGESLGFFQNGALPAWIEEYKEGRLLEGMYYDVNGEIVATIHNGGGFQARYDNSLALRVIEHEVGLPKGMVKEFTPSGKILRTFFTKEGCKNGEEIEYYLTSLDRPKLSIQWKDNMIHGPVKTWYDNGQLQSEREYSFNQKSGPSLAWYRNGNLMCYEEYEKGRLWKGQYYKMQQNEPISCIHNGSGTATLFDEEGSLLRKVVYLNGRPIDPED
ncbi:MAG: hypothetical protein ACD_17C00374G0004 [uncultured bacterium]|nr:MAG: hypothetical protein ACD_17C00374G0004 [uncultured bacterium]OGN56644.1 MAG: hypothetical protein A2796_03670 [Chlamydiae bacterium RIFCSPHIGHO2_01_FULL_44_39]OGN57521.1 MAG: hypothetical protein A3C42_01980 [Chlamydiae bacterium RIFCSPHIGHO2_02_FULL_45_9]OGN61152.1 MAG: hypothetical protein A3D96_05845 [Chlamydiae bacterium RIFCSPHIGHO2_12_FULL_44_59]OGN65622.1 MAG: hypothetical protein A2978_06650 [Chlamydiae bacterium RIFCSPLOWO2_01_FULL_44_52]OGN68099.1 MAG: hypothetical protein A3